MKHKPETVSRAPVSRRILVANWMTTPSSQRLLDGVLEYAAAHGLSWEVEALQMEQTETMRLALETQRPDGVITGFSSQPNLALLSRTSMPTVYLRYYDVEFPASRRRLSVFRLDFGEVGRAAARHFLEQGGYRSFGFVEAPRDPLWSRSRGDAFLAAAGHGGRPTFRYSTLTGTHQAAFARPSELTSLAEWLNALPKPAAVFAAQDERARDTILACRQAGLEVPLSVSVIGVNNDEFTCRHIYPNLSSVEIDGAALGRAAAEDLHRLMNGGRPVRRDFGVAVAGVMARASSAPPAPSGVLVQRALDWIEAHACEGAGAADVAKALNVSRSLLDLRFRQLRYGTLLKAIHDRRLREVRRLLRETDDSIEAICGGAGFGEPAGLRHLFKRRFGCSMREWRKTNSGALQQ